ncbi:hypothetical protein GE09DRAFT_235245 [Coniochaeta sp. 2T2.1]|nr:hypothetical protein GE09DRAFT_235245 [Coniochaeta sp. 2T2.1]
MSTFPVIQSGGKGHDGSLVRPPLLMVAATIWQRRSEGTERPVCPIAHHRWSMPFHRPNYPVPCDQHTAGSASITSSPCRVACASSRSKQRRITRSVISFSSCPQADPVHLLPLTILATEGRQYLLFFRIDGRAWLQIVGCATVIVSLSRSSTTNCWHRRGLDNAESLALPCAGTEGRRSIRRRVGACGRIAAANKTCAVLCCAC